MSNVSEETIPETRVRILSEIAEHELAIRELRAILPSAFKTLFCFRCKPQRKVWVYAATREEADQKLHARMSQDYGDGWEIASQAVDEFDHPEQACGMADSNVFRCLIRPDAEQLLDDWDENEKGLDPNRPRKLKSRLERDVEAYRFNRY